jgi:hypothetical protein
MLLQITQSWFAALLNGSFDASCKHHTAAQVAVPCSHGLMITWQNPTNQVQAVL